MPMEAINYGAQGGQIGAEMMNSEIDQKRRQGNDRIGQYSLLMQAAAKETDPEKQTQLRQAAEGLIPPAMRVIHKDGTSSIGDGSGHNVRHAEGVKRMGIQAELQDYLASGKFDNQKAMSPQQIAQLPPNEQQLFKMAGYARTLQLEEAKRRAQQQTQAQQPSVAAQVSTPGAPTPPPASTPLIAPGSVGASSATLQGLISQGNNALSSQISPAITPPVTPPPTQPVTQTPVSSQQPQSVSRMLSGVRNPFGAPPANKGVTPQQNLYNLFNKATASPAFDKAAGGSNNSNIYSRGIAD